MKQKPNYGIIFGLILMIMAFVSFAIVFFGGSSDETPSEREQILTAIIRDQQNILDIRLNAINQLRSELQQCRSLNGG